MSGQSSAGNFGPHVAEGLGELGGIVAEEDRVEVVAVHVRVGARGGRDVFGPLGRGILGLEIDDESDLVRAARAIVAHRGAVRAEEIVRDDRHFADVAMTGRVRAEHEAIVHHDPRLVERHPARNAIVERAKARVRVLGEPVRDVAIEPAAAVVERFGEIPVVERDHRRDVLREERVDEFVVEGDAGGVDLARALWEDASPVDAEAIRREPELGHQVDIGGVAVVVIGGDVARIVVDDVAGRVTELLPDARPRTIRERRPFDLIRRRGGAPQKSIGKAVVATHLDRRCVWPA